jgi:type I restriction enzyme S subunit
MESVTKKPNVPALRFPEFSGEWQKSRLGDVAELVSGIALPSEDILESGKRLIARGINVKSGYVERSAEIDRYTDSSVEDKFIVSEGDVLVPMDGSKLGKNVATADIGLDGAVLIQRVARIRAYRGVCSNKYLFQLLFNWRFERHVFGVYTSSAIPHISIGELKKYLIPLGGLAEQEKVAAFLTAVDERFGLLKRKKELLEEYKKGVMQRLFSREIRFKDEEGNEYPEWEEKRLGEVVEQRTESGEFEAIMLSVTINNGIKRFSDLGKKDNSNPDKSKYQLVQTGDIVYNTLRLWQGASGISHEKGFVSPAYTVLTAKDGNLNEFIAFWMKLPSSIFMFQRNSQGLTSDQWTCKFKSFSTIKTSFPKTGEQKRIVAFLNGIESRVELLDKQIWNLAMFKKALMQNMFV